MFDVCTKLFLETLETNNIQSRQREKNVISSASIVLELELIMSAHNIYRLVLISDPLVHLLLPYESIIYYQGLWLWRSN